MSKLVRDDAVYVSWQTRKALGYVATATGDTVDGIVETVMAKWVQDHHPAITAHMKAQWEAEDAFRKEFAELMKGPQDENNL